MYSWSKLSVEGFSFMNRAASARYSILIGSRHPWRAFRFMKNISFHPQTKPLGPSTIKNMLQCILIRLPDGRTSYPKRARIRLGWCATKGWGSQRRHGLCRGLIIHGATHVPIRQTDLSRVHPTV